MKKSVLLAGLGLVLLASVVVTLKMACAEDSVNRADAARERVTPVLNSFLDPVSYTHLTLPTNREV